MSEQELFSSGGHREPGEGAGILTELDEVFRMAMQDSRAVRSIVTRPHPLLVQVRRGSRAVVIAPGRVWDLARELFIPYSMKIASGEVMLILIGNVQEPELDRVINRGLACLLDERPSSQALHVALHSAFEAMAARSRGESRGKWLNRYRYELGELVEIARAMTTEREIDRLLGVILEKARFISGADAGSIYVVEGDDREMGRRVLRFKLTQNDSVHFDWREFTVPISPHSISGASALETKVINIADVYDLPVGTPYSVDRSFDEKIKYRTRSMLCAPLVNKAGEAMGVLQLINRKQDPSHRLLTPEDFEEQVIAFDARSEELLATLAAQAGICLENATLYEEIRKIFEGFVHASVEAIEQRDPTTSGHSRRVANLSLGLARSLEREETGPYRDVTFSAHDLRELEYASLLHDFGKIGVREQVLVKAKKLHPSELVQIRMRFDLALRSAEVECLQRRLEAFRKGADLSVVEEIEKEFERRRGFLDDSFRTVLSANEPTVLEEGEFAQIDGIMREVFTGVDGTLSALLTEREAANLKIPRGSLSLPEIEEIRSHVTHTRRFLNRIPWGTSFRRIPLIAGAHHERLDGTGYPNRLHAEEIPLQSKIMSVADIFDALTANDRPYKAAVPAERALSILDNEVRDHHLDGELVRVFRQARLWADSTS